MSSNTLALCQQSLTVPLTPQNYDYLHSSHHCRLGHERLPNSIKNPVRKRVLPDDKVHEGGETDSPGNRCCCGSWKHGSPRHIEYFNLFFAEKLGGNRLQKECDTICQGAETGKKWETRTNLGFEISQVPFYERSCKEYILCTCRKSLPGVHLVYLHASRPATAIVVSYLTYLWFSTSSASSDHVDSPYEHRSDKLQSHTPPPRQISRSATSTSGYLVWDHVAIANQNPAPTQVMKRADKKL
jgi:hypothetical protein